MISEVSKKLMLLNKIKNSKIKEIYNFSKNRDN